MKRSYPEPNLYVELAEYSNRYQYFGNTEREHQDAIWNTIENGELHSSSPLINIRKCLAKLKASKEVPEELKTEKELLARAYVACHCDDDYICVRVLFSLGPNKNYASELAQFREKIEKEQAKQTKEKLKQEIAEKQKQLKRISK